MQPPKLRRRLACSAFPADAHPLEGLPAHSRASSRHISRAVGEIITNRRSVSDLADPSHPIRNRFALCSRSGRNRSALTKRVATLVPVEQQ